MPDRRHDDNRIDAYLPPEMARRAEQAGAAKAGRDALSLFVLAVLAGAFIAFGAIFMTTAIAGGEAMPWGVRRLLGGSVFSLGLILVVVGGAELFTGDNLMVMAWAGRRITLLRLLRAWGIVWLGNLVGALGTAGMLFLSGQYMMGGGAVGRTALEIARAKTGLPFTEAVILGILCNVLVCLAVWMSFSARTVVGKVFAVVPPVAAFVAAGFEHSIANMYFMPVAVLIRRYAPDEFWGQLVTFPVAYSEITVGATVMNLLPVTLGNIIGGGVFVGAVYWFIYLRRG